MADEAPEHLMREANEWDEVESPVVVQARRRVRALDLDQDSEDENEGHTQLEDNMMRRRLRSRQDPSSLRPLAKERLWVAWPWVT
jgi:hypothetical protein